MADDLEQVSTDFPTRAAGPRRAVPLARVGWWAGDRTAYRAAKRMLDVLGAGLGLAITSPLLLAAAVAVRVDSPGPAIFRQVRMGRNGVPFTMYKFRGMYVDARERFPELYAYRYSEEEVLKLYFHVRDDPRVTRVGRFLRRTSIDEMPNLWNVLRGEMSLVGPRPEIPEMLPYYGARLEAFLAAKPGITSLAKCSGRDELNFADTLELELEYVAKRSLGLDVKILGRTLRQVLGWNAL